MTEIEKTFELYQLEEIVSVTFQQYCEVVLFLATLHLSIYRLSFELMTLHLNTRDVDGTPYRSKVLSNTTTSARKCQKNASAYRAHTTTAAFLVTIWQRRLGDWSDSLIVQFGRCD